MTADQTDNRIASSDSIWSREQDKAFENALAIYAEDSLDRWDNIAADVPGKTLEEIKHHYELLLDDVNRIESGCVPLPCYYSSSDAHGSSATHSGDDGTSSKKSASFNNDSTHGGKSSRSDQERRKGIAWTEEEHRLFLLGLDKYGKGDWRSISRNFVVTRTPTQVASHAQKYFIRLNSINKERRRSSIHDITSVNSADVSGPITGQANGSATGPVSGKTSKPTPQTAATNSGVGMYGTPTIGQPVGGPLVPAVGTPVNANLHPSPAHIAYPVPGAPMNMGPTSMAYPIPMPHAPAHPHR